MIQLNTDSFSIHRNLRLIQATVPRYIYYAFSLVAFLLLFGADLTNNEKRDTDFSLFQQCTSFNYLENTPLCLLYPDGLPTTNLANYVIELQGPKLPVPQKSPAIGWFRPRCWSLFSERSKLELLPGATVLLNVLDSGHHKWLVFVQIRPTVGHLQDCSLDWVTIDTEPSGNLSNTNEGVQWVPGQWWEDVQPSSIKFARIDVTDKSHFIVDYRTVGSAVEGSLHEDEKIVFNIGDPVGTPRTGQVDKRDIISSHVSSTEP